MPTAPLVRIAEDATLGLLVGVASLTTIGLPDFDDRRGERARGRRGGGPDRAHVQLDGWETGAILALVVALAFRRTAPRAAYLGTLAATAVFLLAGGPYALVLLGPALAAHTLMTRLPPRQSMPLLVAVPVALSAGFWRQPWLGLADPGLYLAVVLGTAGILLPGLVSLVLVGRQNAERQDLAAERARQAYEERL